MESLGSKGHVILTLFLGTVMIWGLVGCSVKSGPKSNLIVVRAAAKTGMSEFDLTSKVGAPAHIEIDGDTRKLRFESESGPQSITVTFKQNVLTEIQEN